MYVDRSFIEDVACAETREIGSRSKLPAPIKTIISMIFDVENMKQTMQEFEVSSAFAPINNAPLVLVID